MSLTRRVGSIARSVPLCTSWQDVQCIALAPGSWPLSIRTGGRTSSTLRPQRGRSPAATARSATPRSSVTAACSSFAVRKWNESDSRLRSAGHSTELANSSIAGVHSAAQAFIVPVSGAGWNQNVVINGRRYTARDELVNVNAVSPDYFRTMGTPLLTGRDFDYHRDTLKAPRHHIEADDVDTEIARLYKAIAASDKQLAKIKEKLASENESDYHIITAHQMMLHDEHLVGAAVSYIREELVNAEWAARKAVDDITRVFDQLEDEYLRERRSDVEFVFERVLRNLLGRELGPLSPPPDAIVVAYDLSPADTAQLHKAAVAGLVTDAGGKTSHTAIIARAHEIPAVVGL